MVAAITNFTASSLTPVASSVTAQSVAPPKAKPSSSVPTENTPSAANSIEQINRAQIQKTQARENTEIAQAVRELQEGETQQQQTEIKLPEAQNGFVLSDTYRIVGSAPDFQVHSTGNSVYLTHSSGYIISIATGQEREKIQFNDSSSRVQQVMKLGSEALPNPTDNIPNNGYTRSGNLDQLAVPTGLLQNIQA